MLKPLSRINKSFRSQGVCFLLHDNLLMCTGDGTLDVLKEPLTLTALIFPTKSLVTPSWKNVKSQAVFFLLASASVSFGGEKKQKLDLANACDQVKIST